MKINIYNKKMERVLIIDENFVSCLWSEDYNDEGKFSLEVVSSQEIRAKVKPDFFVGRNDRKTVMVIKSIEEKSGKIEISGKGAISILEDVGFAGEIASGSPLDSAVKEAYEQSNQFQYLTISADGSALTLNNSFSRGQLLDATLLACKSTDTGVKAIRRNGGIEIQFYRPDEKEELVFSEKFGNVIVKSLLRTVVGSKNAILCFYKTISGAEKSLEIDKSTGGDKKLLIYDSGATKDATDTDSTYLQKVLDDAEKKLAKYGDVFSISLQTNPIDYGKKYDLGDIITVILPYGEKVKARIVSVSEKCQRNETTLTVTVGDAMKVKR